MRPGPSTEDVVVPEAPDADLGLEGGILKSLNAAAPGLGGGGGGKRVEDQVPEGGN